ncbi:hypothetical protein A2U01_0062476, partial [Trifolium medium]|nr:hypothetical protein [Trifolium medium]
MNLRVSVEGGECWQRWMTAAPARELGETER